MMNPHTAALLKKYIWPGTTAVLCIVFSVMLLAQVGYLDNVRWPSFSSGSSSSDDGFFPSSSDSSTDIAGLEPPAGTFIAIDDLSASGVEFDGYNYHLNGEGMTLRGTVSPNITKIVVAYKTGQDEHVLTRFVAGNTTWEYNIRLYLGNLMRGYNEYEIRAYVDDDHQPVISQFGVNADFYRSEVTEDVGAIQVDWHEPIKVDTLEFLKDFTLREEGKKLIMAYETFWGDSMSGLTLMERLPKTFEFHTIGDVSAGHYAGSTVYHVKVMQEGMCGGDPNNYHRILRAPDNTLTFLSKYSDGVDSRLYELLPFIVDKFVTMNLYPPDKIAVPGLPLTLEKKDSYNSFMPTENSTETLFFSKESAVTMLFDNDRKCYVSRHPDGTFSTYLLELPTRSISDEQREAQEQTGKFLRTGEGILDITWNDGSKNNTQYVSRDYFGGFDLGCSYVLVDVEDGKLLPDAMNGYKGGPLEQIGTASWGAPVYREVYSQAELENVEAELAKEYGTPIRRLFATYRNYYSETKPTIADFYADYHVLYIADPFGRTIEFIDMNVIPAAEKCKPVIYLYPEEETDVSVSVAPKGGFSLTIPEYRDGWNVRATPESVITDLQDGQEYPYLFWEGFGSPGYRMHDEGFVVAREQIACTLPSLLQAQGLRSKEITDFMEYWQPRLQEKPYYYITFMPQAEFEEEAPLSIEPKPDTIIRVFMDYEGLDKPIPVVPQKLTAPVREGFTVIEWGGAKH